MLPKQYAEESGKKDDIIVAFISLIITFVPIYNK